MQAIQMQQMCVGRAPQMPVPPLNSTPLEISREMRQQLRVARHRAFERRQENAQWTKELLDGRVTQDDALVMPSGLATSPMEMQKQIEAKNQAAEELERQLVQQKEQEQEAQRRFKEMLTTLKTAGDAATLKECEEKVAAEKKLLLSSNQRKMEIVRL